MELKQIKELMASMGRSGIVELSLKNEGFELLLKREGREGVQPELWTESEMSNGREYQTIRKAPQELPSTQSLTPMNLPVQAKEEIPGVYITSPMVGTFYSSPSPEDPFFVKVGDRVEKNTVVCIVEAMKVMNEIKAGHAGVITDLLVDSGNPVEFGSKLFKISP